MITALAGGVGASRLLSGMVRVVDPATLTVIANISDDAVMHGLYVSPDVDTLIYTLAGASNPDSGWGLAGETWNAMGTLERLGGEAWFRLGDRDIGTHLFRTGRLADGASLTEVTRDIARAWGLTLRILPMSDDPVRTMVKLAEPRSDGDRPNEELVPGVDSPNHESAPGDEISFQDYFVRLRNLPPVAALRFAGAEAAEPAPGVLAALDNADTVVICPSNPLVSIGPILSIPGIPEHLARARDRTVAVSPLVGGRALKGPLDRMMKELGHEPSVTGIARLYAPYASVLVIDEVDAALAGAVEDEGLECVVTRTVMESPEVAAELAKVVTGCAG